MADNPPGKSSDYPGNYQPELLVSIPRTENRAVLGIESDNLPFNGADVWNAYELSCLNLHGKPLVFIGRFVFPADSEYLVESKSLKLYLNSLNQESLDSSAKFTETIRLDLSKAAGAAVDVSVFDPDAAVLPDMPGGICLDDLDIIIESYEVSRDLLRPQDSPFEEIVDEVLYSHLFRSNCPITNQPDWATVTICYRGKRISREHLLKYLVSYRQHNDYHENCVERIFCDIRAVYDPVDLTVEANFLRRGGLDINPVRTTQSGLDYQAFPRYQRQ